MERKSKNFKNPKQIYEDYLNFTAEYTAWSGKKFLNTLKTVVEDIDERQKRKINSDEYDKLQDKVLKLNPKKDDGPSSDPKISTRKSINLLVKLGFVNTGLSNYHRLSKEYYETLADRNREIIFSKIVHESSSLSSSVREYDPRKHINFLIETLIRAEDFITKGNLIAFFTVDPLEYKEGYIKLNELRKIDTPENLKDFFIRKYNQVNHFCRVLNNMNDLQWHENIIGFKEDIRRKYQKDIDNKDRERSSYQDRQTKEYLEEINKKLTGFANMCMVTNIRYPTLTASHIKRSKLCDHDEKYDPNNIILVSPEINELFDKGDITFENDGKIIFAKNVDTILQNKLKEHKLNIKFINKERGFYLDWNRNSWFNKQTRHL